MRAALVLLAVAACGDSSGPQLVTVDAPGGRFGVALDTDGTRIVVGAPEANTAYVLEDTDGWKVTATLTGTVPNSYFGCAVAIQGNRIVVGARYLSAVEIFDRDAATNTWTEVAQVTGPGEFGGAVDLDSGRILVGAELAGSAYIVEGSGATWSIAATIDGPGGGDRLGHAVQLRGNRAYVGSLGKPGAVRVFNHAGATWDLFATMAPDDPRTDGLGHGFSVDGDRLAAGVPWFAETSGAVYVYTFDGTTWMTPAPTLPEMPQPGGSFGRGVWLSGDRLIATSIDGPANTVVVHILRQRDGSWSEVAHRELDDGAAGSGFPIGGVEVDLMTIGIGDTAVVGLPGYGASGAVLFQDVAGL